jgi:hypothetical protein
MKVLHVSFSIQRCDPLVIFFTVLLVAEIIYLFYLLSGKQFVSHTIVKHPPTHILSFSLTNLFNYFYLFAYFLRYKIAVNANGVMTAVLWMTGRQRGR